MDITRYIVTADPNDTDGFEYETFGEARAAAQNLNACLIRRIYIYDDEELVEDYRPTAADEEEEDADERCSMIEYVKCDAADIPADTAWDVPPRHQGQIVEIAYSRRPPSRTPATEGAPWQRIRDLSEGPNTRDTYYRRSQHG